MQMEIETRDDGITILRGYVNAVERDSRLLPKSMAKEAPEGFASFSAPIMIREKTFARALEKGENILFKFNHGRTIGDTESGSLKLEEDSIGLRAEATTDDPEIRQAAQEGRLTGWSFGFLAKKATWENAGRYDRRTIDEMDLKEVSILTKTPAYIGTSIELRSYDEEQETANTENFRRLVSVMKLKRK